MDNFFYQANGIINPMVVFVLLVAAIEGIYQTINARTKGKAYDWKSYITSSIDLLLRRSVMFYFPYLLSLPLINWLYQHRIYTVPSFSLIGFTVLFLGAEFCYYWLHRFNHKIRWFWASHIVHHSPNVFNLSVAYRWGLTTQFSGAAFIFAPMAFFGCDPKVVMYIVAYNFIYQYWLHLEWMPKLGWAEHIFNTPSHHRVHHACNPEYNHGNYGGILIIFDKLFGTCVVERDDIAKQYGLKKPILSYNPLYIAFYEWRALIRDIWHASNWRDRLHYIVKHPGWKPINSHIQQPKPLVPSFTLGPRSTVVDGTGEQ